MPSSRRRGWYCSAAARLQPPVDERPARTAPGLVRPYLSRTRARRRGRARRSPAPRGRRGASFFYADREHGRARRARWAARIPRTPALGTCSHAPLSTSPPTTLRTADRSGVRARSREQGALVQRSVPSRPACRSAPPRGASSPRLLRPGGRWVLEGAALLRVCAVGSPVRTGSTRPRPARARPTPRQGTVGALSLLGAWGQPACARYAPNSLSCAYTARLAGGTRERVCFCLLPCVAL